MSVEVIQAVGMGGAVLLMAIFLLLDYRRSRTDGPTETKKNPNAEIFQRLSELEKKTASFETHISINQRSLDRIEEKLDRKMDRLE